MEDEFHKRCKCTLSYSVLTISLAFLEGSHFLVGWGPTSFDQHVLLDFMTTYYPFSLLEPILSNSNAHQSNWAIESLNHKSIK